MRCPRRRLRCAPTCRIGRRDGAGISSLRLTVAALRKVQALVGVEPTANDQVVTDTISGLARQAAAPRQAYALTAQALAVVTATACQPRVGRGG